MSGGVGWFGGARGRFKVRPRPLKRNITSWFALLRPSESQRVTGEFFGITRRNHHFDALCCSLRAALPR